MLNIHLAGSKDLDLRTGDVHYTPFRPALPQRFRKMIKHHAAAQMAASGLMMFWPLYFGAEPPIGSNIETPSGLILPPAAMPCPLDHRAKVGDDCREKVVGHNHVEHSDSGQTTW